MSYFISPARRGFTLIEMIVSLGVFAVVVTITTGALITLIAGNQRYQREQNTTTNLAFALDSMTREIRTGYNYYCASGVAVTEAPFSGTHEDPSGTVIDTGITTPTMRRDCAAGRGANTFHGISFYEGGNSITTGTGVRRILYYFDVTAGTIYRRVGNGPSESIISDSIQITGANIFISHTGQLLANNDANQPTVTIHLEARERADVGGETYLMQTTVTQRSLDL